MDLDSLKSAWQADRLPLPQTKEKEMSQIIQMIDQEVNSMMAQDSRRFFRMMVRMVGMTLLAAILFYTMSDGFTNGEDSISTLAIVTFIFLPIFVFAWSRYQGTRTLLEMPNVDVRSQLDRAIAQLQRNQKSVMAMTMILAMLTAVGTVVALTTQSVAVFPIMASLLVAIGVSWHNWRTYRSRLAELNGYADQLDELEG